MRSVRTGGAEAYYLNLLEYVSRKYQDIIIDQKRWNRSNRITHMFVVEPSNASDLEKALKKTLAGQIIRVVPGENIIRIYVYIRKADQYTNTRS